MGVKITALYQEGSITVGLISIQILLAIFVKYIQFFNALAQGISERIRLAPNSSRIYNPWQRLSRQEPNALSIRYKMEASRRTLPTRAHSAALKSCRFAFLYSVIPLPLPTTPTLASGLSGTAKMLPFLPADRKPACTHCAHAMSNTALRRLSVVQ